MSDEPRRRNTEEEIRSLGASQGKVRAHGLLALAAGALTVVAAAAAVAMLPSERPPALPLPVAAADEPATLQPEPVQEPASAPGHRNRSRRQPRDPIARLVEPVEVPRPAGATGPVRRAEPETALDELARSLASQKRGAVQLCFERELKRNPRTRGTAMVTVDLKAPHMLARISVHDTLHRPEFTRCVERAMRNIDFPRLTEDLSVEIPFALKTPDL